LETILFKNEHLAIGNFGQIAVVVAVFSALFSAIAYAFSTNAKYKDLLNFGRLFFIVQSIAVFAVFITLFSIIQNHYYEYHYAYKHSSNDLPIYYMISCFWEGQEGSFLLWMFWHVVLGLILMKSAKTWEAPVLAIVALAQVVLGSMLMGIHVGDIKIGSSPFILLREHSPEALLIPMLEKIGRANYLQIYKDGNGLNPLLQNYWMVIHPPTLFLGFAATIVPFAYAFAGLWTKRIKEWTIPVLPWALVAVLVLGTGIIMGGYWAYESLTFGGYWAWDPVENASLMPWLLIITALHLLLINKSTGKYPVLTMVLTIFSFFMVLYATFLTRSGVLGNASVHSFTDLGLSGQLLLFLFLFIALTFALSFKKRKQAALFFGIVFTTLMLLVFWPFNTSMVTVSIIGSIILLVSTIWFISNLFNLYASGLENDKAYSRELWMLIGSMVLLLSGLHIITQTSIPVFNKLFNTSRAPRGEDYYNLWQMPFAVMVVFLTGIGQFFKYKNSDAKKFWEPVLTALLISVMLSVGALYLFKLWDIKYLLLLIGGIFAIVANMHYIRVVLKGKIKLAGASIAHAGFGLMMVGVLVSSVNKKVLSDNSRGQGFFAEKTEDGKVDQNAITNNKENILLAKGRPVSLANNTLEATYQKSKEIAPNKYFEVSYKFFDEKGALKDSFVLQPNSQNNPKMGLVNNPDTRHFLTRDIFTHITFESGLEKVEEQNFDHFKTDTVGIGGIFVTEDGTRQLTFNNINVIEASKDLKMLHLQAEIIVNSLGDTFIARPEFISEDRIRIKESIINEAGIMVIMDRIIQDENDERNMKFIVTTATRRPKIDYIILKAIEFPYINLLWGGTLIMIFGFTLSIFQRFKEAKRRRLLE
jgi:cytochrome c-type biogenesis protein CcmF